MKVTILAQSFAKVIERKRKNKKENLMFSIKTYCKKFSQYYLVFIGVTSYLYDDYNNTWRENLWTRIWAIISNCIALIMWAYTFHLYMLPFHLVPNVHPLLKSVTCINLLVRTVALFYTIGHRKWREAIKMDLIMQLTSIEWKYFDIYSKCNEKIDKRFKKLIYVKYFALLYFHLFTIYTTSQMPLTLNSFNWPFIFVAATILNMMHVVIFQFYKILWNICRLYFYLNCHLQRLHTKCKPRKCKNISPELDKILKIHFGLSGILRRTLKIYQFQLIANRISISLASAIIAYCGYVLLFHYQIPVLHFGLGIISYLIMTADAYLIDLICDMINQSYRDLLISVQTFNETNMLLRKVSFVPCNKNN